jgi:predicted aminopeptidase
MVEGQLNQLFSDRAQLADWIRDSGHDDRIETVLAKAARIRGKYEFGKLPKNACCCYCDCRKPPSLLLPQASVLRTRG